MGAPQQVLLAYGAAAGGASDPHFASVAMLLHFDGTNGSTTFVNDGSGGDPTALGGAALTTSGPLFGSACCNFPAGGDDGADSTDTHYPIGTNEFTVELAVKFTPTASQMILFDYNGAAFNGTNAFWLVYNRAGTDKFEFYTSGIKISGGAASAGVWTRIAVSRAAGTTRLFQDGVQIGSSYTDSNNYHYGGATAQITVGCAQGPANGLIGVIDEVRVTNGVGRYTTTYTVATAAFPNS